jgi:hypothetical protein
MDLINKKWSCDLEVRKIDQHHYILTNKNLEVSIEIMGDYSAELMIYLYYDNKKMLMYYGDVKGKDLLDKIDTIILKYNNLPDLIDDVKKVLREQLEANDIFQVNIEVYSSCDHWKIECYENGNSKDPIIELQFQELNNMTLFYHKIQVIDKYKYYVDIELHDISVNLYDIEQALSKTLKLQLQEIKQDDI